MHLTIGQFPHSQNHKRLRTNHHLIFFSLDAAFRFHSLTHSLIFHVHSITRNSKNWRRRRKLPRKWQNIYDSVDRQCGFKTKRNLIDSRKRSLLTINNARQWLTNQKPLYYHVLEFTCLLAWPQRAIEIRNKSETYFWRWRKKNTEEKTNDDVSKKKCHWSVRVNRVYVCIGLWDGNVDAGDRYSEVSKVANLYETIIRIHTQWMLLWFDRNIHTLCAQFSIFESNTKFSCQ